jgi:hypothetical protein
MVFDFSDRGKGYLYDVAVRAFNLHTWSRQCLRGFHASHNASDVASVESNNLDVVLAVERLECREGLGDFHSSYFPFRSSYALRHMNSVKRLAILRSSLSDVHRTSDETRTAYLLRGIAGLAKRTKIITK